MDVAEVDDGYIHTLQLPYEISGRDDAYHDKENKEVGVRESGYELGYGVIGHDRVEQLSLMYPAEMARGSCHLYPYRVCRVLWQCAIVCHNQMFAVPDCKRVGGHVAQNLFRLLRNERKRV